MGVVMGSPLCWDTLPYITPVWGCLPFNYTPTLSHWFPVHQYVSGISVCYVGISLLLKGLGVTIPPFGTINIHGNIDVQGHCMWVHMLTKPAQGSLLPTSVVPTATYGGLQPGSSQVPICLRNPSAHPMVIPTKVVVGKVTLANQVPPVVLPMGT